MAASAIRRFALGALLGSGILLHPADPCRGQDIFGLITNGEISPASTAGEGVLFPPESGMMIPDKGSLNLSWRSDLYYREQRSDGGMNHGGREERTLSLVLPFRRGPVPLALTVEHASGKVHFDARQSTDSQSGDADVAYDGSVQQTRIGVYVQPASVFSIGAGAAVESGGAGNGNAWSAFGGMNYALDDHTRLALNMTSRSYSDEMNIVITGINGVLPSQVRADGAAAAFHTSISSLFLSIDGGRDILHRETDWQTDRSLNGIPSGKIDHLGTDLEYSFNPALRGSMRFGYSRLHGEMEFRDGYEQYGDLAAAAWRDRFINGRLKWGGNGSTGYSVTAEWRMIEGSGSGYVETWPFISIIQSLLPVREYYTASGRLEMLSLHASSLFAIGEKTDLTAGFRALQLHPQLVVETWQPTFLIFGMRAYRRNELSIETADIGLLSLGITRRFGDFELSYAFSQLLPLRIVQRQSEDGSGSAISGVSSASDATATKTTGGQFHYVTLGMKF